MKNMIILLVFPLLAAACSNERPDEAQYEVQDEAHHGADASCEDDGLVVSNAWIRAARAGQPTSAAYFSLCNGGPDDDALISFTFAGAQAAELHTTTLSDDSRVSMAPTKEITVGANAQAKLEPEGQHVMLIGLKAPLIAGETTTAVLSFQHAPDITVEFEIRDTTSNHQNHH